MSLKDELVAQGVEKNPIRYLRLYEEIYHQGSCFLGRGHLQVYLAQRPRILKCGQRRDGVLWREHLFAIRVNDDFSVECEHIGSAPMPKDKGRGGKQLATATSHHKEYYQTLLRSERPT